MTVQTPLEGDQLTGGNYGNKLTYHNFKKQRLTMTAQQVQDSISRYEGNMFLGSRLAVPFSGNPVYSEDAEQDTVNVTVEGKCQFILYITSK